MESLCNNFKEMMFDFIDGELTKSQLDEFNYHLSGCVPCQNELQQRIKTIKLIADSVYIPKKNLQKSVINNIKLLKKNKLRIRYGSTIAACVVAVVILTNFAFMYLFQNNVNKSDDRAVQETDVIDSENSIKSFGIEKSTDDLNDETIITEAESPLQGIASFEPDKENESVTETSEASLPSSDRLNLKSAADMIIYNTQLYAPDYTGKVSMVILSEQAVTADGLLLKDASNYKVYIFDYTPETAELLQQSADKNSTVYEDQSKEDSSYILYIYLTQS